MFIKQKRALKQAGKLGICCAIVLIIYVHFFKVNVRHKCSGLPGNGTRYITFEITDSRRLGNYMFNIASLIGIARTNHLTPVIMDTLPDHVMHKIQQFKPYLPLVEESCFYGYQYLVLHDGIPRIYNKHSKHLLSHLGATSTHTLVVLKGYWHSWRYFWNSRHEVNEALQMRQDIMTEVKLRHRDIMHKIYLQTAIENTSKTSKSTIGLFDTKNDAHINARNAKQISNGTIHQRQNNSATLKRLSKYKTQKMNRIINHKQSPVISEEKPLLIGIHIRRGDMTDAMYSRQGYATVTPDYILRSMRHLEATQRPLHPGRTLYYWVTSDDLVWAWTYVEKLRPHVITAEISSPHVDMALLSLCDHVITTFGSFSWWAGYLAGGQVIYWNNFIRPGSQLSRIVSTTDLYPPGWIGLF